MPHPVHCGAGKERDEHRRGDHPDDHRGRVQSGYLHGQECSCVSNDPGPHHRCEPVGTYVREDLGGTLQLAEQPTTPSTAFAAPA